MDVALIAVVISGVVSIAVAVMVNLLARRKEREADWRKMKLHLFREYIVALSGQLNDLTKIDMRYLDATNAVTLVAPPAVLTAIYSFNDAFFRKHPDNPAGKIQSLLTELRRDIHPRLRHGSEDFEYRLVRTPAAPVTDSSLPVESD